MVFEAFWGHRKASAVHPQATILSPGQFPLVSGSTTTFFIELSKPIIFSIFFDSVPSNIDFETFFDS